MAYLVGATTVIDASGNVPWARITGAPSSGVGNIVTVNTSNGTPASGVNVLSGSAQSSNCTANCYVESISGSGTSGTVTVASARKSFNCNCNCQCRC
jgi:hypothetical protein